MSQLLFVVALAVIVLIGLAWGWWRRAHAPRASIQGYESPRAPDERGRSGGT